MCMSVKRDHQSEIFSYYRNVTSCHIQTKEWNCSTKLHLEKINMKLPENDSLLKMIISSIQNSLKEEKNSKYLNTKHFT